MKYLLFCFLLFSSLVVCSQNNSNRGKQELYKNYREDQFYVSITYNLLNFKAPSISQTGFSPGLHLGFIRDMPINKKRNVAIGLGLGISSNIYNQNLSIIRANDKISFTVFDDRQNNVAQNRFSTFLVEVPLEFRWRTSKPEEYSFWRIYTGLKIGYMVYNTTTLKSSAGDQKLSNLDVFNRLQYGLTFNAGYNTWNVHFYYSLSRLFNDESTLNSQPIELAPFKIGLIFYIL